MNKTINNNRLGRAEKRPAIRALTILQPYAHLIATGEKFVENRCWRIRNPPRYIVIHAGKGHRLLEYDDEERYSEMVFGAFVAVAFLSAVIDVRDRDRFATNNEGYEWLSTHSHAEGPNLLIFPQVWRLPTPIAAVGAQGFWEIQPSDVAQIREVFSTIKPFVASELCLLPQG